ncbi:MAG: hypothetical protein ABJ251_13350 [Paracoccaceae bacterium]
MKGSNSRLSHQAADRYSNIAHVQGGMVTDSDLTVAGQIHQSRDEAQNAVTMWSGCPAQNGAVAIDEDGNATLRPGWIIAQGKQGWLVQVDGAETSLPLQQVDLPLGPSLPEKNALLYADLWERPIFAAQDNSLIDPGLHGAETSYRTRTMVQVKSLPVENEEVWQKALAAIEENSGFFARMGNARASVAPRNTEIATDECDPCADQIDITPTVPNALFRFEVIAVDYDGDEPRSLMVAWSLENAAEISAASALEDPSARDAFAGPGAVYEFFSDITDSQIGRFADHDPERPVLTDTLFPVPAAGSSNGGVPYSYVRRWDGFAEINLQTRVVEGKGTGTLIAEPTRMTLTLDAFALTISTNNSQFLAGDYWLVELRRFAVEADRVRLVSPLPQGIVHHFCPLFRVEADGSSTALTDAEKRRLSFPALSDIPASHVSFDPACPPLFHDAENVQDALNALCDLNATEVAFDPGDNCPRFEGTSTVDEALKRMCQIQDDTTTTRLLRLMMDWGVVCGIGLKQGKETLVSWTDGTILDRAGRLIDVAAGESSLQDLPAENILSNIAQTMELDGELCLSMGADKEGKLQLYVSDRSTAFGPTDRTFSEAIEACLAGKKRVDFGDFYRPLAPEDSKVIEGMIQVWTNRNTLSGAVPMTENEGRVAAAFNKTLLNDYKEKATPERVERVDKLIALAEVEYNPSGTRGNNRDILRMQLESAKLGIIANSEEEDRIACQCQNALVPCPPDAGDPPYLVPIACFRTTPTGRDQITNIQSLCHFCCRKQSQNWRSSRYYFGSVLEQRLNEVANLCCTETDPPNDGFDDWIGDWDDDIFKPGGKPLPTPEPLPDPLWPPKVPPDYDVLIPTRPGAEPGIVTPISGKDFVSVVNIDTLPPAQAEETLVGNGFDVVDTINLDDGANPLVKLEALGLQGGIRSGKDIGEPGDKVAMLVRGDKTVDYVVVEKGNGRLPFETDTELTERVTKALEKIEFPDGKGVGGIERPTDVSTPDFDLSALNDQLTAFEAERQLAEASTRELTTTREALGADVENLRSDITKLTEIRVEVAAEIAQSKAEFEAIEEKKTVSLRELSDAVNELETVKTEAEEIGRSIRAEQPVRVLLGGNEQVTRALEEKGIVSLRDIATMNSNSLNAVLRSAGADINSSELKAKADSIINRR